MQAAGLDIPQHPDGEKPEKPREQLHELSPTEPLHSLASSRMAYFGGPDRPAGALRDLLEERIEAVPEGGAIDWMTYYFRDERLADALIRAHRRGVRVRICVEARPRRGSANRQVIDRLSDPILGIGRGLQAVRHILPLHLHTKLYCFSHPRPTAFVGSFNPSGNEPENLNLIADIGDQDRGHNLLVELTDPAVVGALTERVAALHASGGRFRRPWRLADSIVAAGDLQGVFFPLFAQSPLQCRLHALNPGSTLRIAASHVRDPFVTRTLVSLARRGVSVMLLTGHTLRRTPRRRERHLIDAGVRVVRFSHPDKLPMHSKFMLAEGPGVRWASFGSYNLTLTSRWLNHELLMFSTSAELWRGLDQRWHDILASSLPAS
jgi:phosphatidylserine/phosphatidylglycerophosphate/cardiolipin synthase-like enzyme